MNRFLRVACLLPVLWLLALPAAQSAPLAEVHAAIATALLQADPDLKVAEVRTTPVDGLYEVLLHDGMLVYSSADGRHVIEGSLYRLGQGSMVSLTEQRLAGIRAARLAQVKREDMIIFSPAPPQAVKAALYVFTDVDCGYCQTFHQDVPQLTRAGIEVRYLAWPRAGYDSDTFRKMATAWCAKDRQQALTRLKRREPMPINVCEGNPVAAQFRLGQELGIRGTPALVFADGTLQPGYIPAPRLIPMLLNPGLPR